MEGFMGMIYNNIIQESKTFTEISRRLETRLQDKVRELGIDDTHKEAVCMELYDFLGIAQEAYFKLGFRYGIQFMSEMQPECEWR